MHLNLKATPVFERNYDAVTRIVVNQGGTRSSKTYSLMQLAVILAFEETESCVITIARKTLPALKATAYKDFLDVLKGADIYDERHHNKTELTYQIGRAEVEFISVDQPQKIRGRKRKYLFMNEANEFSHEDFRQLNMRTTKRVYMDYNPSDEYHWIYEHVLTRPDCTFIQSTYKDNPFLEPEIIKEIELFKATDENYWRIYGLGERGVSNVKIYTHWQLIDDLPEGGEDIWGIDFGYNHQTAITQNRLKDDVLYSKERLYKRFMHNIDRIAFLKECVEAGHLTYSTYIYGDTEDPGAISEIAEAGFNIKPADKEAGSVKRGIETIKARKWFITKDSVNMQKEARGYSWKVKEEQVLDEPVKVNDHLMDAVRYPVYTHLNAPFVGFV